MFRLPGRSAGGILAGVVAFGLALSGCGSSSSPASSTASAGAGANKAYTVGFSNPTGAQPILNTIQAALTAAGKNLNIKVKSLDAQLDPNKQVSDINQFVAEHVDAIIVFPISQDSLTPALDRARQAGVKVLGDNAILRPDDPMGPYDANFDEGEDFQGAQLLADYVGEQLKGAGNVLGVGIGVPVPSLHFMLENYQKYVTAKGLKWVGTASNPTDDIAGAQKAVAAQLTKNQNNIQAVMAYNDDSAIGAAVAFKQAGVANPIIVGQNGDQQGVDAIKDGRMSAMVDIVPWREGLIGITMVKALLDGKSVPKWIATPVEMYTKANIDKRLDWNAAVQQIAAGTLTCRTGGCPEQITAISSP